MKLSFIFVSVLVSSLAYSEAKTFLEVTEQDAEREQAVAEMPEDMFQVLLNALADNNVPDDRLVKQMEVALGPMFKTLHTNSLGNLAPQVARYALHRLFEQRHSWSVLGLRPKESNVSADLDTEGIPRTNLAVLAAILERKIHQEFIGQVTSSYVAVGRSLEDSMTRADLEEFVKRFLTLFIAGERDYSLGSDEVSKHMEFMANSTKDWPETLQWMSESLRVAIKSQGHCDQSSSECTFGFDDVTGIVEKTVQGYGRFNNKECRRLKDTLLKLEDGKTGRVSLADFYKEGMSGTWEFNEKADYLRDLGALDESTGRPRVIVANYVNSWVNCLQTSDFYSVCCSNECEDILGHLERELEVSAATPEKILKAMQTLPSDISVAVPDSQEGRLHTIADRNHGEVPLHGRLFAQWLHHVFPQSCPFPHQAGATNPLTPDQWLKETGNTAIRATQEEIMMVIGSEGVQNSQDSMNQHMPWTDVEDVVVLHQPVVQDKRHAFADIGVMALEVLATVVMFYIVTRSSGRLRVRFGKGSFKQVSI
jgi:hypothetical protein